MCGLRGPGQVSYQDSRQGLPDVKKVTGHQGRGCQQSQGGGGQHPREQRACTDQIMRDQYWTSGEEPSIKAAQVPGAWPPGATPHTGGPYPDVLWTRLSVKRTETQYSRPGLRLSRTSLLINLAFWKQMKEAVRITTGSVESLWTEEEEAAQRASSDTEPASSPHRWTGSSDCTAETCRCFPSPPGEAESPHTCVLHRAPGSAEAGPDTLEKQRLLDSFISLFT